MLKTCRLESTAQLYIYIYIYIHKISFKTNSSLEINLNIQQKIGDDESKFLARGTYQLTYPNCSNKSVDQVSRFFATDVKNIYFPLKA